MTWIPFEPEIGRQKPELRRFASKVAECAQKGGAFSEFRESFEEEFPTSTECLRLKLAQSLLIDLVEQGWEVSVGKKLCVRTTAIEGETPQAAKERIRKGHLIERDTQLREKSVQEFIESMERRRLAKNGWHSIFSLMRDGRSLSNSIEEARLNIQSDDPFGSAISPYLQFVDADATCEFTGLRLVDIWRYFRLTWVNAHKSVPGRSIMVLVRDAAAENHPVIGIAALGSSVVQQEIRDRWVGWTVDEFMERLEEEPHTRFGQWITNNIEGLIRGIYLTDLIEDGFLRRGDIRQPSRDVIDKLRNEAELAREQHRRYPRAALHKSYADEGKVVWEKAARTKLFRSKRCEMLAKLLSIRIALSEAGFSRGTRAEIKLLLASPAARAAVGQLVRMVKAEHVGIDMMDITVCGAVAPYNRLLGGKLICLLLASPEVVLHYGRRYSEQESVIASSMKGVSVCRAPRLVLLSTTSLYGVGSSQYNRLKVSCNEVGGIAGEQLEYRRLGLSKGFGSFHFSGTTLDLMNVLLARRAEGRRVNSIFGEGVNPLMRKIRDALEELGLPSDKILNHGNPRVVYGVALARNFRDVLLGIAKEPQYLMPLRAGRRGTERLAAYWRKRWLTPRIADPRTLDAVADHTLAYPITHGARVARVGLDSNQMPLL